MALINLPAARKRLVATIAAVPAGEKLHIPRLRDSLVSQADVLAAIAALVDEGKLDRQTLRPPIRAERKSLPEGRRRGQSADGVAALPLFDGLVAEGKRRGLSAQQTSLAMFNNKARIYQLRKAETVRVTTADKIRAWIAGPPAVEAAVVEPQPVAELPPAPVPEPAPAPALDVSPFELHRDIRAFLDRTGVSATAFGKAVNGDAVLVGAIRAGRSPQRKTIAKIRALLADPPAEWLARRPVENPRPAIERPALLGDRRFVANRTATERDRHSAAVRRGIGREAERRLSGEKVSGAASPAVRGAMQVITDRKAAEARQINPVEAAQLALQRRGRTVYSATVIGGPKHHFVVSGLGNRVTPAALIAEAERVTGQKFRRGASK